MSRRHLGCRGGINFLLFFLSRFAYPPAAPNAGRKLVFLQFTSFGKEFSQSNLLITLVFLRVLLNTLEDDGVRSLVHDCSLQALGNLLIARQEA